MFFRISVRAVIYLSYIFYLKLLCLKPKTSITPQKENILRFREGPIPFLAAELTIN